HFAWDHAGRMKAFAIRAGTAEPSVQALYLYGPAGSRVKKLVRTQGGKIESTIYIDGLFEHHRWQTNSGAAEKNLLHVMDGRQRIALTRVGLAHPEDRS